MRHTPSEVKRMERGRQSPAQSVRLSAVTKLSYLLKETGLKERSLNDQRVEVSGGSA